MNINYRKNTNENILTPPDLLLKAATEMGEHFDLWCEDKYEENKPHWAFDNYRVGGAMAYGASHLFYTQPGWGNFFANRMQGASNIKLLTYAVDEEIYPELENEYVYDVGFIGNVNDDDGRKPYLEMLTENYNCLVSSSVPTGEIAKELSKCRVLFNHIRYEEINIRFFESLACGAQVVSYSPALHLFAEEGKHYLTFKSIPEAIEKIDYLLTSPNIIKKMKKEARKEVVKRHTYKQRVKEIVDFL